MKPPTPKASLLQLYTNGSLFTKATIERLRQMPPFTIDISCHSVTEEPFDWFTQVPESFRAFVRGLELLRNSGLPLTLKTKKAMNWRRGTRTLPDRDLLVHGQDLPAIHRLLIEAGFIQQIDGNPTYVSSQSTLALDLLSELWYLDEEGLVALWRRARTRLLRRLTVKQLISDDLLLYLTAYSVVHREHLSPSFFTDLLLLIEKEPPHWLTIAEEAIRCHLKIPLYNGLRQLARSNSTRIDIPSAVMQQLAPATLSEHVLECLFRRLVTTQSVPELGHFYSGSRNHQDAGRPGFAARSFPHRSS